MAATRKFELPGIQDLTKEQEQIRALPKIGQHLIVGGPGTGKSVVSLIRARRLAQDDEDYVFLVYNHLLHRASRQLFGEHIVSDTWISWFLRLFKEVMGQSAPRLPRRKSGFPPIDWATLHNLVEQSSASNSSAKPFLVIDEGQDMPPIFYDTLVRFGFENFFVACDQNQQITEENSSRKDIEDCLGLDVEDVIELTYNHRNAYPVARLAHEFYPGDPASPRPDLPDRHSVTAPILYSYNRLDTAVARILTRLERQPNRLIGVIAPNNKVRERYFKALQTVAESVSRNSSRPNIETFHGNTRPDVRFDQGGIIVINVQACKGLEFDDVILADIDRYKVRHDYLDEIKKQFYVM
ncbi:MAG: hypothetical protein F4Y37_00735, partial [Caldilineaceae bacterium SB0664_bin_22]|nr:hypothetical protein [Caldilineaceae bacterium SB0664_bin_22]